jgi:hypothetical protein
MKQQDTPSFAEHLADGERESLLASTKHQARKQKTPVQDHNQHRGTPEDKQQEQDISVNEKQEHDTLGSEEPENKEQSSVAEANQTKYKERESEGTAENGDIEEVTETDKTGSKEEGEDENEPTQEEIEKAKQIMETTMKDAKSILEELPEYSLNPFNSEETQKSVVTELKNKVPKIKEYLDNPKEHSLEARATLTDILDTYVKGIDRIADIHPDLRERHKKTVYYLLDYFNEKSLSKLSNAGEDDFEQWMQKVQSLGRRADTASTVLQQLDFVALNPSRHSPPPAPYGAGGVLRTDQTSSSVMQQERCVACQGHEMHSGSRTVF